MRRWILVGAVCAAFLAGAVPAAAGSGPTIWRTTIAGPVLHGGATVTERPVARVRFAAAVHDALPATRPVMELVGAGCGTKGPVLGVALMTPATAAGQSAGLEIFSTPQTAVFDTWVRAGRTISVHIVGRGPNVTRTQSCGVLTRVG